MPEWGRYRPDAGSIGPISTQLCHIMPRLKDQWHFSGNGRAHGDGDLVHGDPVHGGLAHGDPVHGGLDHGGGRVHGEVAHGGGVRGGGVHGGVGQGGGVRGAALGDAVPDDAALDAGDDAVPGDAGSDAEGYGLGDKVPALSETREIVVYQTNSNMTLTEFLFEKVTATVKKMIVIRPILSLVFAPEIFTATTPVLSLTKFSCILTTLRLPLQWHHNERDGVSNHRRFDCLLNRLFMRRSKKTPKLRVTGLCEGNPPVTKGQ